MKVSTDSRDGFQSGNRLFGFGHYGDENYPNGFPVEIYKGSIDVKNFQFELNHWYKEIFASSFIFFLQLWRFSLF